MIKKALIAVLLSLFIVAGHKQAGAHVVITDQSGSYGSILHVSPDDDPIAGKEASLFFDIQGSALDEAANAELAITDSEGNQHIIPMVINKNSVNANYTFRWQGIYSLELLIKQTSRSDIKFNYDQRVSRGDIKGSKTNYPRYIWAEMMMLVSLISICVLFILFFNRRKVIFDNNKL